MLYIAIHMYTRNKIRAFTCMDVSQRLSLVSKLACNYQTCELQVNDTRVMMHGSEEICKHTRIFAFECPV